jgi:hypothetical protein
LITAYILRPAIPYLTETMKENSMPEDIQKMLGKLHAKIED